MLKLLIATVALLTLGGCAAPPAPLATPAAVNIDTLAARAMAATGARGLAIAVVEGGRVTHVGAYGQRNDKGEPLTPDTVMYGASLTKAVFATTVMQLVDQRKLDLDRPIATLLPQPLPEYGKDPAAVRAYAQYGPLAGDPRWQRITPRMALSHSTGFGNFFFLEEDRRARIHFEPGSRYGYSGEGLILLQLGLERGLGLSLRELTDANFQRLGMTRTSLIWRDDFAANLADGWTQDGRLEPHDQRSRVRAAGSMDTTIADFARFAAAFIRGDLVSPSARAEMLRPQLRITSGQQFPTLAPQLPPEQQRPDLNAGLGLVLFTGPQGPGFYKGGHDDSTGNTWVCVERGQRCVVILGNDVRAEAAFPAIVKAVLGETGVPFGWEYGSKKFWSGEGGQ